MRGTRGSRRENIFRREFGTKLRAARKAARMTQYELAQSIGAEANQVCTWELGNGVPSLENALRLEEALKQPLLPRPSSGPAAVNRALLVLARAAQEIDNLANSLREDEE